MALIRTCDRCKAVGSETVDVVTLELAFPLAAELPSRRVDLCGECQRDVLAFILEKPVTATVDGERIPVPSLESIDTVERRHVAGIMVATKWVKSEAARILGIERSTLDRKLKIWGISRPSAVNKIVEPARTVGHTFTGAFQMGYPQVQFVDHNDRTGQFVVQFADSKDPRVTTRFTAMTLEGLLRTAEAYLLWTHQSCTDSAAFQNERSRLHDLAQTVAESTAGDASTQFLGPRDLSNYVAGLHGRPVFLKTDTAVLTGLVLRTNVGVRLIDACSEIHDFDADQIQDIRLV